MQFPIVQLLLVVIDINTFVNSPRFGNGSVSLNQAKTITTVRMVIKGQFILDLNKKTAITGDDYLVSVISDSCERENAATKKITSKLKSSQCSRRCQVCCRCMG